MRRVSLAYLCLLLWACGDDGGNTKMDAAVGSEDAAIDAAVDASALTLDCASYCTAILEVCQGADEQYESQMNCLATCTKFATVGAVTDTTGNTIGCRVYHTELARTDPTTHCPHAGPTGGGSCGTTCEAACDVIADLCPALPANQWKNNCATNCASTGTAFTGTYSTGAAMSGDTVECRIYYATAGNCDAASRTQSAACQ